MITAVASQRSPQPYQSTKRRKPSMLDGTRGTNPTRAANRLTVGVRRGRSTRLCCRYSLSSAGHPSSARGTGYLLDQWHGGPRLVRRAVGDIPSGCPWQEPELGSPGLCGEDARCRGAAKLQQRVNRSYHLETPASVIVNDLLAELPGKQSVCYRRAAARKPRHDGKASELGFAVALDHRSPLAARIIPGPRPPVDNFSNLP
ncbi:hypothetical protein LZ30DRAFT_478759 [Colletotrichum cereale]|nr:hypothetical protein LZ30DRAFT_478759 [Colletotrichum cereale]